MKKVLTTMLVSFVLILTIALAACSTGGGQTTTNQGQTIEPPNENPVPILSIENVIVSEVDHTVTFDVCVKNNPGILNMVLSMSFDDEVFGFNTAVKGDALPSASFTKPGSKVTTSPYNFLFDAMELTEDDKTDGVLFTVTLTIKDSAATGNYNVVFSYIVGDIVDENFENIDVQIENGTIILE